MQYAQLGRTGVQVSRLGLGTLPFGWKTREADSFALMDQALELGINLIDTANVYGVPQPPPEWRGEGIAEQKVQDLQEQINAYRDLSTSLARREA